MDAAHLEFVMTNPEQNLTPQDSTLPFSPRSLEFWRHIVGMAILLAVLPPYISAYNWSHYSMSALEEFLGTLVAKILFAIFPAGVLTLLGLLFFTDRVKGRHWDLFVMIAWFCGFLGVFLLWYGKSER